jgi:hypothetical protein
MLEMRIFLLGQRGERCGKEEESKMRLRQSGQQINRK